MVSESITRINSDFKGNGRHYDKVFHAFLHVYFFMGSHKSFLFSNQDPKINK